MRFIYVGIACILALGLSGLGGPEHIPPNLQAYGVPPQEKPMPKFSMGLKVPADIQARTVQSWRKHGVRLQSLPIVTAASFDCRAFGWVSAVKDQADCGSCHAMAGTRAAESSQLKAGYGKPDRSFLLAEQAVMDCGNTGGCNGGWPEDTLAFAMKRGIPTVDRYVDATGTYEGYGAYKAREGNCKSFDKMKVFKIADYGYVGSESGVPPVQAIKDAMVKFGPIIVALAADNAFSNHRAGTVFKGSGSRDINHAVTLIGWDDAKGAWLLQNSWSEEWCDNGYMWIAFGANQVGFGAMWCVATALPPAPPPPPDPIPPPGPISNDLKRITLTYGDGSKREHDVVPSGTGAIIEELLSKFRPAPKQTVEPPGEAKEIRDLREALMKQADIIEQIQKQLIPKKTSYNTDGGRGEQELPSVHRHFFTRF